MTAIKTTLKNLSETEIEITCEITVEEFEKERASAMKRIGAEVSLPGFRKGHIPDNVLVQKFGEAFVLDEMANLAMDRAYPEILRTHKVAAIARPSVQIKKLAQGNPFEFSITFPVLPEITLPDYKKIAHEAMKGTEDTDATEKEVKEAQEQLLKQFATKDSEGNEVTPELTLDLAQKFGPFTTIDEFSVKIKESITHEKTIRAKEKKRMQTMEKIGDGITVKIPDILIDGELDRMLHMFQGDVERMGMKFDEYLKTIKKTKEDFLKEWRTDAEKRVKIEIALSKIAHAENLEVPQEELEREVKFFIEKYKDVDHARAEDHLRMMLTNEKVFQFLESQK